MSRLRWLRVLSALGAEFWLLLPVVGLIFWLGTGLVTDRILDRVSKTEDYLKIDRKRERSLTKTVKSITVITNQNLDISFVNVQIDDESLKSLEFEFSTTNPSQLESAISRELGLPQEQIRSLMIYRRK
jgi:hypothetical protein